MGQKEFHYRWEYDLSASPQALWPLVSDTNRFNRDAGLPDVSTQGSMDGLGSFGRRRLKLSGGATRAEAQYPVRPPRPLYVQFTFPTRVWK